MRRLAAVTDSVTSAACRGSMLSVARRRERLDRVGHDAAPPGRSSPCGRTKRWTNASIRVRSVTPRQRRRQLGAVLVEVAGQLDVPALLAQQIVEMQRALLPFCVAVDDGEDRAARRWPPRSRRSC